MCGEGCGRVYLYGVSGEVCWLVGKGCGERNGGGLGKCVRVWGPNTLPPTLPLISLTSPFPTSPFTSPTLQHTSLYLLLYLFPHLPSSSCTPTHFPTIPTYGISPHVLKVWQSYHVTKFLWQSYCGEVTMWRSYWQPATSPFLLLHPHTLSYYPHISPLTFSKCGKVTM